MPEPSSPSRAWAGWGDPARRPELPDSVREMLIGALRLDGDEHAPVAAEDVEVAEPRLSPAARDALCTAVGAEHVLDSRDERLGHAGGQSYLDLVRRRAGEARVPDAVVVPGSHAEVCAVLRACSEHRVAVVPYGGATSVVGGVEPEAGGLDAVVSLDVRRLDLLAEIDETDRTATLEAGLTAPRAEALLAEQGWTIGHVPQSFEHATIGGFAATRSSGQSSSGYGRFDDLVERLLVATPQGDLDLGRAPASAAGPDLRQLFLGSEGALGVITEVSVRIRPLPGRRHYEGWRLPGFAAGTTVLRALAQERISPDVVRLSDEAESALSLAGAGGAGGCLAILGWEGGAAAVDARRAAVMPALEAAGAESLGTDAGEAWLDGRFRAPYLRDALLDLGVLAETLETACPWSRLDDLHAAVAGALRDTLADHRPIVMAHVSHVYAAGASLYFTVLARRDHTDPEAQWQAAKRAAGDAIARVGATITHHHAVGLDHRDWMEPEVGALGVEVLRAIKRRLDPAGIMNPGKLIPPAG